MSCGLPRWLNRAPMVEKIGVADHDAGQAARFIDAMVPVYEKHVTDDVLKNMVADVQAVQ